MSGGDVWSKAIGGAVIVNACTLVGTILLGLSALKLSGTNIIQATAVASGFAGGVLLAAAIFLILPESLHLIAEDYSDETEVNYRFGIMVLVGFIVVLFLDVLVASIVKASMRKRAAQAPTDLETDLPTKDKESAVDEVTQYENARVLAAVVAGDAMHNFADGVFIASAFQLCSSTVGWIIVVSTIAHELPQELADFVLLTKVVNIRPFRALVFNFISGMTVHLGVIVVLAAQVSPSAVGMILAFGGGLYLYSAAVEAVPRMTKGDDPKLKMLALACFIIGAIAIGLVLINHEHCEGDHAHGPHDVGHDDHGHDDHGHDDHGHDDHDHDH